MFAATILPKFSASYISYRKTSFFVPIYENFDRNGCFPDKGGLSCPIRDLPLCSTQVPPLENKRDGHRVGQAPVCRDGRKT